MKRLDERIGELHIEGAEAKSNFQELHKERVRLNKERGGKKDEIADWQKRCMDLQMLKFGRGVDLDELEADADRTKEDEAEELIHEIEEVTKKKTDEIWAEINDLKEKLAQVCVSVFLWTCVCFYLSFWFCFLFVDDDSQHSTAECCGRPDGRQTEHHSVSQFGRQEYPSRLRSCRADPRQRRASEDIFICAAASKRNRESSH